MLPGVKLLLIAIDTQNKLLIGSNLLLLLLQAVMMILKAALFRKISTAYIWSYFP